MLHDPNGNGDSRGAIESANDTLKALGNLLHLLAHAWSAMIFAFTRHSFGQRYFNLWGLGGVLVLSAWAVFTVPPHEMLLHNIMLFSFLFLAAFHRARAPKMFRGGPVHSRYDGWPRVCDALGIPESTAKWFVEPLLVSAIGGLLCAINVSLGLFIVIGAGMGILDRAFVHDMQLERARQMRDAEIEQDAVMDVYDRYFDS